MSCGHEYPGRGVSLPDPLGRDVVVLGPVAVLDQDAVGLASDLLDLAVPDTEAVIPGSNGRPPVGLVRGRRHLMVHHELGRRHHGRGGTGDPVIADVCC